jgi:hypothetical protein
MVNVKGEPVPFGGVPVMDAVFAPGLLVNTAHDGNPLPTVKVAAGEPVPVTVNVPALPTANVTEFTLVIVGAELTVLLRIV